jgi:hypothetical protein
MTSSLPAEDTVRAISNENNRRSMNKNKLRAFLILWVIIGWIYPGSAAAYVLRGPHVLELMTRELKLPNRMLVRQKEFLFDSAEDGRIVELDEDVRYLRPGNFRSDIETAEVKRIHVVSGGQALSVLDGRVTEKAGTRFDRYKDIFLFQNRKQLESHLAALGVNCGVSSLGRLEDRTAYVIGARYPDFGPTQIWIDQETLLPLRWMQSDANAEGQRDLFEIRYQDWRSTEKTWYPGRIDFFLNTTLIREIIIETVAVNPEMDVDLFNIERLRSIHPAAAPLEKEPSESEQMREVNKTIEEFKKKFE